MEDLLKVLMRTVDVIIVGAGLSAAAAKRLVDAGLESFQLPRSGILSPHLHRKEADYWAIQRSGAEVHDQTSFIGLQDNGDHVIVQAKRMGEPVECRARQVIGADGPSSPVIRALYPEYQQSIPWFIVEQKFHEIIECPLDEQYFISGFTPISGSIQCGAGYEERRIGRARNCGAIAEAAEKSLSAIAFQQFLILCLFHISGKYGVHFFLFYVARFRQVFFKGDFFHVVI